MHGRRERSGTLISIEYISTNDGDDDDYGSIIIGTGIGYSNGIIGTGIQASCSTPGTSKRSVESGPEAPGGREADRIPVQRQYREARAPHGGGGQEHD